jgi:hypothetical protein
VSDSEPNSSERSNAGVIDRIDGRDEKQRLDQEVDLLSGIAKGVSGVDEVLFFEAVQRVSNRPIGKQRLLGELAL